MRLIRKQYHAEARRTQCCDKQCEPRRHKEHEEGRIFESLEFFLCVLCAFVVNFSPPRSLRYLRLCVRHFCEKNRIGDQIREQ
jgi:hypothetical protein